MKRRRTAEEGTGMSPAEEDRIIGRHLRELKVRGGYDIRHHRHGFTWQTDVKIAGDIEISGTGTNLMETLRAAVVRVLQRAEARARSGG
jgi:hypothetical protein